MRSYHYLSCDIRHISPFKCLLQAMMSPSQVLRLLQTMARTEHLWIRCRNYVAVYPEQKLRSVVYPV
ncbi:uncharacterized protein PHALS_15052 [Plasmopara halstedii]|uniref:Uncharacterized protein n=1 Tax=Plasmopara halstedii TaxID=4781 RepID=A0A0P1B0L9_PLAHL|nr:uncharacterized protein PHALS_15052 [Plasmopara halstedii]CEG47703.1 hypothetical protein PHALS_15052 [Plasmopara halstedii]|eukprot:XP_024584072.1 hypothetical protein PHALS_15052 [Plasmopara halstedii]